MEINRLVSVVRVLVFYLIAMTGLLLVGSVLQITLGLPGVILMQLIVFLALPLLFTRRVERKPLKSFLRLHMLSGKGIAKSVLLGAVCWLMAQTMGSALLLLIRQMGGEMVQPYQILLDAPIWLALFAGALVPAITEELSFRGYIQGALRPLGPTLAILLTGILFGAMHLSLIRLLPLSLLGILWAMVVQRSGSVVPGMIMHFLNNGIALGLTFLLRGRANPADLSALDTIPPAALWVTIAILTAMSLGFAVAAYFLAASFGRSDLADPEAAAEAEPESTHAEPAFQDPDQVPAEIRSLEAELAGLRRRRRTMLQAVAILAGLLCLSIFLVLASQEIAMAFR